MQANTETPKIDASAFKTGVCSQMHFYFNGRSVTTCVECEIAFSGKHPITDFHGETMETRGKIIGLYESYIWFKGAPS